MLQVTGKKHVKELYKADLDMGDGSVAANNTNVVKDIFFADSKSHKKKGASLTGKPPTLAVMKTYIFAPSPHVFNKFQYFVCVAHPVIFMIDQV